MSKAKGYSRKFRFFLVKTLVVAVFISVGGRLVVVQGVQRTELREKAERQIPSPDNTAPLRNAILDRNGIPLVETVKVYSCFIDPFMVDDPRRTSEILAKELRMSASTIRKKINGTKGRFVWAKRDVPITTVSRIQEKRLKGVGFKLEPRRHYPQGLMASHLLGLVGLDGSGLSGIEQRYDKVLRGHSDIKASGKIPAGSVQLTIDGPIQQIVEKELDWAAKRTGAKRGTVLVQDVKTGEILSLANWPPLSLDPDHPPASEDLTIPAVSDVFEPGSTFKVVVAAAALEENAVSPRETFDGEDGAYKVADIVIHDHHALGVMTFDEVFIHSSNIGTAKISEKIGSERLYQYARLFGFGVYPGANLPGETKGLLRPPSRWSGVSKQVISFGQEVGVNSLQMVGAYSAIANGGKLMEPLVLKGIVGKNQKPLWENTPSEVRRVISEKTAARLKTILARVVEEGTGSNAKLKYATHVKVAGKTGTAQKYDNEKKKYSDTKTLVSFSGFFPVDSPRLSILVILDEPEGRRWGGVDAAPLFSRIADQITSHIFL